MNNQERCAIKTLKLLNFRCFEELNISFNDRLSVFVAPNGCGKTAILDAVAIALRLFTDTIEERPTSKGFEARDIRLVQNPLGQMEQVTPVRFEAYGCFFDRCISWSRERQSEKSSRTTITEAQS
ncbi:MAG TPA: ATP-binding protein, partial [Candidatus Rifleibacterium sp.]|nr:ATP-binding protein [Candidatus Rifleibacterium sp.]